MTWAAAQSAAERTSDPLGNTPKPGHLGCISSAAENMFVYQRVAGFYIWLGLTDSERHGGKEAGDDRNGGSGWLTGEPLTFQAWRSIEPNENEATGEDAVSVAASGRWGTRRVAKTISRKPCAPR